MPSVRKEGDKRELVWNWGSHVDQMIREAQKRGDFDNLPGAGKPLNLDDNVFAGEMDAAFRIAKNANAAPLWVQLDREIGEEKERLDSYLERTARYIKEMKGSAAARQAERARARALYLKRVAAMNEKVLEYNVIRPRQLTWLEKVGVPERIAAATFDEKIPPFPGDAALPRTP